MCSLQSRPEPATLSSLDRLRRYELSEPAVVSNKESSMGWEASGLNEAESHPKRAAIPSAARTLWTWSNAVSSKRYLSLVCLSCDTWPCCHCAAAVRKWQNMSWRGHDLNFEKLRHLCVLEWTIKGFCATLQNHGMLRVSAELAKPSWMSRLAS